MKFKQFLDAASWGLRLSPPPRRAYESPLKLAAENVQRLLDDEGLTEQVNASLIAKGYDAECVNWLCEKHDRHCTHLGSDHTKHECIWCGRRQAMNRDEFEAGYAQRSGVTVEWLHEHGRQAEPCDCDYSGCEGWQMGHLQPPAHIRETRVRYE